MKIALAQYNYHTGNFAQNTAKVLSGIQKAREAGASVVVFSELALCGYPARDFLEFDDFLLLCQESLEQIQKASEGIAVVVGIPRRNPDPLGKSLFNSAVVIENGDITGEYHKILLPNYDVFDEYRYFEPGAKAKTLTIAGQKVAITICEDLWNIEEPHLYRRTPMNELIEERPRLIINLAASPFSLNQAKKREQILSKNAAHYGLPLVYVNHCGAQTELIFDGNSCVYNAQGQKVKQLLAFEEDFAWVDLNALPSETQSALPDMESLRQALVLGIRDYFQKQGFKKAILGLSGGIDSALMSVLAAQALGPENVHVLLMPSPYSSEHSISDSVTLVERLGITHDIIPIENAFSAVLQTLNPHFVDLPFNVAEENIQSRLRGMLLMAFTNKFGYILLNTSNKSELAVGYGTLYGDMCGGISVIGDLYKTQVYALCEWINRESEVIPSNILTKAPSAELRPNQKDSDSLPDYALLDDLLERYIEQRQSPEQLLQFGFEEALVSRVMKLVNTNEYKRHQSPPILRVSDKAFGQGRRMPIVARYLS